MPPGSFLLLKVWGEINKLREALLKKEPKLDDFENSQPFWLAKGDEIKTCQRSIQDPFQGEWWSKGKAEAVPIKPFVKTWEGNALGYSSVTLKALSQTIGLLAFLAGPQGRGREEFLLERSMGITFVYCGEICRKSTVARTEQEKNQYKMKRGCWTPLAFCWQEAGWESAQQLTHATFHQKGKMTQRLEAGA